ncbi:MAG: beta-ketoacyl-[acyl-carrier-protein] synthase II, partial [Zoogloeaceae bacterium]|nr:beta-ketoacyl-[acyl-carrier-protein] synthase II [Zoogloeaceae bacterium]
MKPLLSSSCTAVSALGSGLAATRAALQKNASGLSACDFLDATLDTQIGRVSGLEAFTLPADLADYDCRNNRLAVLALQQDGFAQAVAQA